MDYEINWIQAFKYVSEPIVNFSQIKLIGETPLLKRSNISFNSEDGVWTIYRENNNEYFIVNIGFNEQYRTYRLMGVPNVENLVAYQDQIYIKSDSSYSYYKVVNQQLVLISVSNLDLFNFNISNGQFYALLRRFDSQEVVKLDGLNYTTILKVDGNKYHFLISSKYIVLVGTFTTLIYDYEGKLVKTLTESISISDFFHELILFTYKVGYTTFFTLYNIETDQRFPVSIPASIIRGRILINNQILFVKVITLERIDYCVYSIENPKKLIEKQYKNEGIFTSLLSSNNDRRFMIISEQTHQRNIKLYSY